MSSQHFLSFLATFAHTKTEKENITASNVKNSHFYIRICSPGILITHYQNRVSKRKT